MSQYPNIIQYSNCAHQSAPPFNVLVVPIQNNAVNATQSICFSPTHVQVFPVVSFLPTSHKTHEFISFFEYQMYVMKRRPSLSPYTTSTTTVTTSGDHDCLLVECPWFRRNVIKEGQAQMTYVWCLHGLLNVYRGCIFRVV